MGWTKDRVVTLVEALTITKVLAIPALFSVVLLAARESLFVGNWFSGTSLFGVPSWTWGLAAGLILTMNFIWAYATRLRLQAEPKFEVTFNPQGEGIVETPTEIYKNGVKVRDDRAVYLRITLNASSLVTARSCVAYVTKLEKRKEHGGIFNEIPINGSLPVTAHPIDIFPGIPEIVDFLKSGEGDNRLDPTYPWPFRLRGALDDVATYRFTICVNGDGLSRNITTEVEWNGKWDTIKARQVEASR